MGESRVKTTRRTFLGGIAAVSIPPSAVVAMAVAEPAAPTIDQFLALATPAERARYHMNALTDVMAEIHPDKAWRNAMDTQYHFILVTGDTRQDAET